jgi:hypothetical protein
MTPILRIMGRDCRCLLAVVVRDGDELLICRSDLNREQVSTTADRWESRRIRPSKTPLTEDLRMYTLGCKHAHVMVDPGGPAAGVTIVGPKAIIDATKRTTRRGGTFLV